MTPIHYQLLLLAAFCGLIILAMGIVVRRRALRVAELEALLRDTRSDVEETMSALDRTSATLLRDGDQEFKRVQAERDHWERRFWEQHAIIERVLKQGDVWKDMWHDQVLQHAEGQSALEYKLVLHRQHTIRAVATANHWKKKAEGDDFKPILTPAGLLPLDGEPVGQAERYVERMRDLLINKAPKEFDALRKRDELVARIEAEDAPKDDAPAPPSDDEPLITATPLLKPKVVEATEPAPELTPVTVDA